MQWQKHEESSVFQTTYQIDILTVLGIFHQIKQGDISKDNEIADHHKKGATNIEIKENCHVGAHIHQAPPSPRRAPSCRTRR